MTARGIVFAAIAGAVSRVALFATIGGKRLDAAGMSLVDHGLVVPIRYGGLIESAAAGVLVAWLFSGGAARKILPSGSPN
jgi:hypothetical protein